MINQEQFDKLAKYETTSWAIWTDGFNKKGCIEGMSGQPKKYFSENMSKLKNNIVLLGLNRSGNPDKIIPPDKRELGNFHTVGHKGDLCLKETIQDKGFENILGAYMTDLSVTINSDSLGVNITEKDIELFIEKLDILGAEYFHVACFSEDKVFNKIFRFFKNEGEKIIIKNNYCGKVKIKDELKEVSIKEFPVNLGKKHIMFYSVLHYAYVVRDFGNHRRPEFECQMKYLNSKVVDAPHFA